MFKTIIAAVLLALAAPSFADQPSYNYVAAGYQRLEIDDDFGLDLSADGFQVDGSFAIADNWHIIAAYGAADFGYGVDLSQLSIGAGYHSAISANTSFFADLAYIQAEVSASGFGSIDESGYGVRAGLRGMPSERVELEGYVSYADLGDGGDGTSVGGAAWYKFTESFGLGLTASAEEDVFGYGVSARLYFGN